MLPILHLIQLAVHDSPCGEPYWVCIRIIACLFFSGLFSCLFCVSWRMDVYLFSSEPLLLDLCDLPLELVRVWPFYLFFF